MLQRSRFSQLRPGMIPYGFSRTSNTKSFSDGVTFTETGDQSSIYTVGKLLFICNGGNWKLTAVAAVSYTGGITYVRVGQTLINENIEVWYDTSPSLFSTGAFPPGSVYHFENVNKVFYDSTTNAKDQDASGVYIRGTLGGRVSGGRFGSYGWNSPNGCLTGLHAYNASSWCCKAFIKPSDGSEIDLTVVIALPGGDNYDWISMGLFPGSYSYIGFRCDNQSTGNVQFFGSSYTSPIIGMWNEVIWGRNAGVWTIIVNGVSLTASNSYTWANLLSNIPPSTHTPLLGKYYCSAQTSTYTWTGPPSNCVIDEVMVWPSSFPTLSAISNQVSPWGPDAR